MSADRVLPPAPETRAEAHRLVEAGVDGKVVLLDGEELPSLAKTLRHNIEAVVDRLITGKLESSRLNDSVETALRIAIGGNIIDYGCLPDFDLATAETRIREVLTLPLDPAAVVGKKESPYGVTAIVRRDALPAGADFGPVTLEELFIFMVKEDAT